VANTVYSPIGRLMFVFASLVLGLGGLQRERQSGTAALTLALPVSRRRLVTVRAGVGVLQVAVLALLPALIALAMARALVEQPYPATLALAPALLSGSWGIVWFATALLWSTLLVDYTAVLACVLSPFVYLAVYASASRHGLHVPAGDFFEFMSARPYLDPRTFLLVEPLPWVALGVLGAAAMSIVALSALITQRQDF
jgi:ABC-type transport system involved in multi-copper enzyme maturation permease subunit